MLASHSALASFGSQHVESNAEHDSPPSLPIELATADVESAVRRINATGNSFAETGQIPRLFRGFPKQTKSDHAVMNKALEQCNGFRVYELFGQLPTPIKCDLYVVMQALERCYFEYIPRLFKQFPDEIKRDARVVEKSVEKCFRATIQDLFVQFPEDIRNDVSLAKKALTVCSRDSVDRVFLELPREIQQDEGVSQMALRKLSPKLKDGLGERLLKACEGNPYSDPAVFTLALEKCTGAQVVVLYAAYPNSHKASLDMIKQSLDVCGPLWFCPLFELFPEEFRGQASVLTMAFKRLLGGELGDRLISVLKGDLNDPTVFSTTLETCKPYHVHFFMGLFPKATKRDLGIVEQALLKCDERYVGSLFKLCPKESWNDVGLVQIALGRCSEPGALFTEVPEKVRNVTNVVKKALERVKFFDADLTDVAAFASGLTRENEYPFVEKFNQIHKANPERAQEIEEKLPKSVLMLPRMKAAIDRIEDERSLDKMKS